MEDLTVLQSVIIGVIIGVIMGVVYIIGFLAVSAYLRKRRIARMVDLVNQSVFGDDEKKMLIEIETYRINNPNKGCEEFMADTEVKTKDE